MTGDRTPTDVLPGDPAPDALEPIELVPDLSSVQAIKLVGLGGVGGIAARYLAVFLAACDADLRLVLIDGDAFEDGNAARMVFAHCGNKAQVVRDALRPVLGGTRVALVAVEEFLTPENLPRLIGEGDVVLLCVDNHGTRRVVDEHCAGLGDVTLISAGNDGVEPEQGLRGTWGNVQVRLRRGGQDRSPSLGAYHPEIAEARDPPPGSEPVEHCAEQVASVPQILFANLTAASGMLNAFWALSCGSLGYSEVGFDILGGRMRPVDVPPPEVHGLGA
ncbi:MAG: ThiF family adenylyltransferase [Planctomycetota bacterium]